MKKSLLVATTLLLLGLGFWYYQKPDSVQVQVSIKPARATAAVDKTSDSTPTSSPKVQTLPKTDPQLEAQMLMAIKMFLDNLSNENRKKALDLLLNYPLEGMRTLHDVLIKAPFTDPNRRVQLMSLGIDLIEQVNRDLSTMNRVSLAGIEIHKLAEEAVRHELTAPEWVPFTGAANATEDTLENLEHTGEISNQNGQWVRSTLPAKVMSIQLAARLPVGQQTEVSYYVSELNDGSQAHDSLTRASRELLVGRK